MTNTGLVAVFDAQGTERLSCPLPGAPQSAAAVRSGHYYAQMNGSLMAFDLPGLDTASIGWVSQRGNPARDKRAHYEGRRRAGWPSSTVQQRSLNRGRRRPRRFAEPCLGLGELSQETVIRRRLKLLS